MARDLGLRFDQFLVDDLSYSYRARPESQFDIWWNRISVTSLSFGTAIGLAYLLGRKRS